VFAAKQVMDVIALGSELIDVALNDSAKVVKNLTSILTVVCIVTVT
jgi:hypothetical protein